MTEASKPICDRCQRPTCPAWTMVAAVNTERVIPSRDAFADALLDCRNAELLLLRAQIAERNALLFRAGTIITETRRVFSSDHKVRAVVHDLVRLGVLPALGSVPTTTLTPATHYNLSFSPEQAGALRDALELYARIGIGQFEHLLEAYDPHCELPSETRDAIRAACDSAKVEAGFPAHGSHGLHHPQVAERYRIAYDIFQVVRFRLAEDQYPEGHNDTNSRPPRNVAQRPLPTIRKVTV